MTVATLLDRAARVWPNRPALCHGDALHATYRDFARRAAAIGGALRDQYNLEDGARVAIVMGNQPQYLEALFGIWYAGLVAVPVNAKLHAREFAYILNDSGAALCFASPKLVSALPETVRCIVAPSDDWDALCESAPCALPDVAGDSLAWLFYTSGTTGQPKGAMLSHTNLEQMVLSFFADVESLGPADSVLHPAPLSHGSGLYSLAAVHGGANQVVPASGQFDSDEIFGLIARYPGAFFFAAPTMVRRLVAAPGAGQADVANLKSIVYGGGPMYLDDLKAALRLFGPRLGQIYGQGESPMTITCLARSLHEDASDARLSSVGIAHSVVDVRVLNEAGAPAAVGEVGEICVRGPVVMRGYWNRPDATAETLRDGWLHTGDTGAFDADGFLTLKDRVKDVIISGGSNIYPREVEEVLLQHPAVAEVSVVGAPDAEWGEVVIAFVVAEPGVSIDEAALDALCLETIARFKRPKRYRVVDALPKNNYGKVLKTELRALLT